MQDSSAINLSKLRLFATLARAVTVILLLILFTGTHVPTTVSIPSPSSIDKVMHFGAYFIISVSALASWELSTGMLRPQHYFTVWLCGTLFGAFDEVTQIPVGRTCDGLDWLADIAGIVTGLIFFRLARPLMYRVLFGTKNLEA